MRFLIMEGLWLVMSCVLCLVWDLFVIVGTFVVLVKCFEDQESKESER